MKLKLLSMIAAAWILVGSTGCTEVRYITQPLMLPERPTLPAIKAEELQCLSDGAFANIIRRDNARRDYAETLEAIIQSTRP